MSACNNCFTISIPMPLAPPVTMAVLPEFMGISIKKTIYASMYVGIINLKVLLSQFTSHSCMRGDNLATEMYKSDCIGSYKTDRRCDLSTEKS